MEHAQLILKKSDCVCIDSKVVFYWTVTLTEQNEKQFTLPSQRNKDSVSRMG